MGGFVRAEEPGVQCVEGMLGALWDEGDFGGRLEGD